MSEELLAIGERSPGWANDGEQVEVVVVRSRRHRDPASEGEIEQLSSAEDERAPPSASADRRPQSSASVCGHDRRRRAGRRSTRPVDNARLAARRRRARLPEPDGVAVATSTCSMPASPHPTDRKVELAMAIEGESMDADARASAASSRATTSTRSRGAVVSTTGVRTRAARPRAT